MAEVSTENSARVGRERASALKQWAIATLVLGAGTTAWAANRGKTAAAPTAAASASLLAGPTVPNASIAAPERSKAQRQVEFTMPEVPAALANAPAVTLELEVRASGGASQRKTVTRSAGRLHVAIGQGGPEWLFVQNAADPRRVSATMANHPRHTLVEYDESELRLTGLGRGWADVTSLGVEPEQLRKFAPSARARVVSGFRFVEMLRADAAGGIRELWWSEEAAIPLRFVTGDGAERREVTARNIRREVNADLLKDLRDRYPTYAVMDVADYREKHHEHAETSPEAHSH